MAVPPEEGQWEEGGASLEVMNKESLSSPLHDFPTIYSETHSQGKPLIIYLDSGP